MDELYYSIDNDERIETGGILSMCRLPLLFSYSESERNLYFEIIDATCTHLELNLEKHSCIMVLPDNNWKSLVHKTENMIMTKISYLIVNFNKIAEIYKSRIEIVQDALGAGLKLDTNSAFLKKIMTNDIIVHINFNFSE